MRKLLAGMVFMALAGTLTLAVPQHDRDDRHDNGKHKGWDKHEVLDDDRHDNGKHNGWEIPTILITGTGIPTTIASVRDEPILMAATLM